MGPACKLAYPFNASWGHSGPHLINDWLKVHSLPSSNVGKYRGSIKTAYCNKAPHPSIWSGSNSSSIYVFRGWLRSDIKLLKGSWLSIYIERFTFCKPVSPISIIDDYTSWCIWNCQHDWWPLNKMQMRSRFTFHESAEHYTVCITQNLYMLCSAFLYATCRARKVSFAAQILLDVKLNSSAWNLSSYVYYKVNLKWNKELNKASSYYRIDQETLIKNA